MNGMAQSMNASSSMGRANVALTSTPRTVTTSLWTKVRQEL